MSVAKNPFRISLLRGSASGHRNRAVSLRFACRRHRNAPNDSRTSFWSNGGYWVRSCEKFIRSSVAETVHSGTKHLFCFDLRAVGIRMVRNTPKHHLGPKQLNWKCPERKIHSKVRYPEAVHPGTEMEPFRSEAPVLL